MALAPTLLKGALGSLYKRPPYEGATLPPRVLVQPAARIDAGRVATYAEVCGFPRTGPLPVTYPHLLGFPLAMRLMAGRDFPFPLLGLVHTGIELTRRGPLRTGDRPEVRVRAEGPAPHRRGSTFAVVTEVLLDGEEVWSSHSTYLCRHAAPSRAGGGERGGSPDRSEPPGPLPVRDEWTLPAGLGRRYGAASGDRNPIHLHPLTARAFGFPRAIAHGMWAFARCLAEAAPEGDGTPLTATARFLAPVLLPGTVTYGAEDGSFELRDARDAARLHVSGRVSSGSPSSGSPDRSSRSS